MGAVVSPGRRWVPIYGADDVHVAAWLAELSDDQLQRIAFAALSMMHNRGIVQPHFSFTAPVLGLRFEIDVREL